MTSSLLGQKSKAMFLPKLEMRWTKSSWFVVVDVVVVAGVAVGFVVGGGLEFALQILPRNPRFLLEC